MPAPAEIVQLFELFERNYDQYHSPAFSETAVRHQFIDPFFGALGWDVNNAQGFAEQYKEVIHEDKVKVGSAAKAPDYAFRIGKERKFFVEAKKPAVNITHDIEPAYQLRRYAWSAKLPLSILTDFEEFAVYDCRSKPAATDKASAGRILLMTYQEYAARWDEIAAVFSKAAVWQGALDKFAEAKAGKRGTAEVDDEFLAEIERWRELLAHNLVLRNPTLRGRDVNWAVQQTIDRIVFLRICEARDLETFEQLRALLNGGHTYARLQELFRRADLRYNSGLFHFEVEERRGSAEPSAEAPDTLTPSLEIDDKVLKDIIEHLYYPQSPYEFSVLPADILGHVYERFLGKVIRLTPGRQVKIEEKPEVRKAGGVYYTPTYIVDYIVREAVGPLLDGKTPADVGASLADARRPRGAPLRILDAACGSGSFLLGAYQFLLDWHLTEYLKDPDRWLKGKRPPLERASGGITRLSIEERKRILMNNIYGVDIDPQAVEVTKLSLLLKVLEGEGVAAQMSFLPERVLPDLGRNIKCGNSLIGPEFYDGKLDLPDEDTTRRVNAFDWKTEFPEAMAPTSASAGGFDAVIGNPPYIRIQALQEWAPLEVEHYKRAYRAASKGNYDIYVVFVEKGLQLLNEHGKLGFILPNKFLTTDYGRPLRELVAEKKALTAVVDFGHCQVFEEATTYTCLLFLAGSRGTTFRFVSVEPKPEILSQALALRTAAMDTLNGAPWIITSDAAPAIFEQLASKGVPLLDLPAEMSRGSSTGDDDVFVLRLTDQTRVYRAADGETVEIEAGILRTPVFATDFGRYRFDPHNGKVIIFPYKSDARLMGEDELRSQFPKTFSYLTARRRALEKRKQFKAWYGYSAPRNLTLHDAAQLVVPLLADRGLFAELPEARDCLCLMAGGGFSITLSDTTGLHKRYVLGLLNSRLLFWRLNAISNKFRGGWITCTKQYVGTLPIRTINFTDPADVARHDRMVALVTQMLDLHSRLAVEGVPHEKAALQRRIEMTDRQIDALVYELYELTPEEIAVVEGGSG
jgi:hypothetical protein